MIRGISTALPENIRVSVWFCFEHLLCWDSPDSFICLFALLVLSYHGWEANQMSIAPPSPVHTLLPSSGADEIRRWIHVFSRRFFDPQRCRELKVPGSAFKFDWQYTKVSSCVVRQVSPTTTGAAYFKGCDQRRHCRW
jgi:hypothetical protein